MSVAIFSINTIVLCEILPKYFGLGDVPAFMNGVGLWVPRLPSLPSYRLFTPLWQQKLWVSEQEMNVVLCSV